MNERREMVPGPAKTCKKEKDLLCWIRREIITIQKLQTTKATFVMLFDSIIQTMNEQFDDWPEDPK